MPARSRRRAVAVVGLCLAALGGFALLSADTGRRAGPATRLPAVLDDGRAIALGVTTTDTVTVRLQARAAACDGASVITAELDGAMLGAVDVGAPAPDGLQVGGTSDPGRHTLVLRRSTEPGTCDAPIRVESVQVEEGCPVDQYLARYFAGTTPSGRPVLTRCEWSPGGSFTGSPAPGVPADDFSVDFRGRVAVPTSQEHAVHATLGNVGARVWLDGERVIDAWEPGTYGTRTADGPATAGVHDVRVAYASTSGRADFGFVIHRTARGEPSGDGNLFAEDSIWNTPLPPTVTVDPRSDAWIEALDDAVDGVTMNASAWTSTVYRATAGTATATIDVTNNDTRIDIPWREGWRATPDSDAHVAVIDEPTQCLYEFQGFDVASRSAIASATYDVSRGSGNHVAGPAHSGGETSYLAGMITPQDVEDGVIDHALRYAMPGNAPTFVYPGTRSDGTVDGGVPEGTRLRLDPTVDLDDPRWGLSRAQRMVARALQVYGGFNADKGDTLAVYAQSTVDGATTYPTELEGLPDELVSRLQLLTPEHSTVPTFLDRADDPRCSQQRPVQQPSAATVREQRP